MNSKKLSLAIFGILLVACSLARGQNVRYSAPFPSISSTTSTKFLVANVPPNAPIVAVCTVPANATPCTNYATTYTSAGAACPNGSQDTPDPQPSACQSTGDAQGNIGFWAPPGSYDYTVCVSTNCYGPYRVTLAIPQLSGSCTMTSGQCAQITFATAFLNTPSCTVTWTGTGTLTGFLSSQRTSSGLRPKSSVNTDTAVVDWKCQGQPN